MVTPITMTEAVEEAWAAASSDQAHYDTFEIDNDYLSESIKIVVSHSPLTVTLGTFVPVPTIEYELPSTEASARGQLVMRIPGIPRAIRGIARALARSGSVTTIKYRQYLEGETEPDAEMPSTLEVSEIKDVFGTLEITALLPDLVGMFFPRRLMSRRALYGPPVSNTAPPPAGWSGSFFTVGPVGKGPDGDGTYDFGNLWDATQDPGVPDGSILLVYDYTRITNAYGSFSKNLFVRGVGETPISVYMSGLSAYPSLWLNGQSNIVFENLHLIGSGLWHSVISGSSSDVTCMINKCFLDPINENWCVEYYSAGSLTLRNCKLARYKESPWDLPQFSHCDLSKMNLVGVEFYPELKTTGGGNTGSFSDPDYVEEPTPGYGYDYGSFVITDAFLAAHGY
jgi:hypothetical protein